MMQHNRHQEQEQQEQQHSVEGQAAVASQPSRGGVETTKTTTTSTTIETTADEEERRQKLQLGAIKMFQMERIRAEKSGKNKNKNNKSDEKSKQNFFLSSIASITSALTSSSSSTATANSSSTAFLSSDSINTELQQQQQQQAVDPRFVSGVPIKRSGHRAVCSDDFLYIWGGFSPKRKDADEQLSDFEDEEEADGQGQGQAGPAGRAVAANRHSSKLLPELWRFNFSTRKWCMLKTTGNAPNDTVASHSTVLRGNMLLVFGGTGYPFGVNNSNSLHMCNLKTLEWQKIDLRGPAPRPLYGSSAILVDNDLYILFGTDSHNYVCNVYKINLRTHEVRTLFDSIAMIENAGFRERQTLDEEYPGSFLNGRYRQECVFWSNKIYAFGGGDETGSTYQFNEIPAFDVETEQWTFVHTHPDPAYASQQDPTNATSNTAAVAAPARAHNVNMQNDNDDGEDEDDEEDEDEEADDFEEQILNGRGRRRRSLLRKNTGFPERRKFHSCDVVDDYMYMLGGMFADGREFSPVENCAWRLHMPTLTWQKLTSLQMPCLTYFHATCTRPSSGEIYFHGGVKAPKVFVGADQVRINHLYQLTVRIPTLEEMCWRKLLAAYPGSLLKASKEKLLDMGVPLVYAQRLTLG